MQTRRLARQRHRFEVEFQVVRNEQVQVPATVVVEESAAGPPADIGAGQARILCDIGERAVTVVPVQDVLPPIRDEQVVVPAVVVVPDADGRCPAAPHQPGVLGHVGERAVAVVSVQAVGGAGRDSIHETPVQDEDVEPSVVVVIEERRSAADGLEDEARVIGGAVDRGLGEARFAGHVREAGSERQAGSLGARLCPHASGSDALSLKVGGRGDGERKDPPPS